MLSTPVNETFFAGPCMEEGVVLLFYNYVEIPDPQEVCKWQKELCTQLQLKGKIRVAKEGINITLGGTRYTLSTARATLFFWKGHWN